MNVSKLLLGAILAFTSYLHADIEKVSVQWTPNICDAGCAKLLENQFRKINGVADVQINIGAAQAIIQWKPNVPFSYTAIDTAMRMVGPSINDLGLRVKVRGIIRHNDNSVTLVSLGDNTNYFLLSPITPNPTQYVDTESLETHRLWPQVRQEFLEAEAQNLTVTVEGPLFQPERSPPYYIVVEQKKMVQPESQPAD